MNVQNTWQTAQSTDSIFNSLLEVEQLNTLQSISPLAKLKRNVLVGITLGVLITAGYIAGLFLSKLWQVNIAIVAAILFNSWTIWESLRLHRNTGLTNMSRLPVKQELQRQLDSFEQWWILQQRASLFVYPLMVTGGFILGGVSGSGKSVSSFLSRPWVMPLLAITVVALVPLCYFLSKWMFNYSYGKHLKKLKLLIEELN